MGMLIKAVKTGRKAFGDKVPATTSPITIHGVKLELTETDTWSSGEFAGDGEYIRVTMLELKTPIDPWPNIKYSEYSLAKLKSLVD
jgi:hypothetical protein